MEIKVEIQTRAARPSALPATVILARDTEEEIIRLQVSVKRQEVSSVILLSKDQLIEALQALLLLPSPPTASQEAQLQLPAPPTDEVTKTITTPLPGAPPPTEDPNVLLG